MTFRYFSRYVVAITTALALMSCLDFAAAQAIVIPVGPDGAVESFDGEEVVPAGWRTLLLGTLGDAAAVTTEEQLDQHAQSLGLSDLIGGVTPGNLQPSSKAHYSDAGDFLFTQSSVATAIAFSATLQNATGASLSELNVDFDFGVPDVGANTVEELPGYRMYMSWTGAENSWTRIGAFTSPQHVSLNLAVGDWADGAILYLMWLDDNAISVNGSFDQRYSMDNVRFAPVPEPGSAVVAMIAAAGLALCRLHSRRQAAALRFKDHHAERDDYTGRALP